MNPAWKTYLESHSATFDGDLTIFNSNNNLPDCSLFDLSHLGLIKVEGEDSLDFMQGQFTNDVRDLENDLSQLSAVCSPKGRMLGLFRIVKQGDSYLLQMPPHIRDTLLKRLQMFVLRSKVTLADASDSVARIGLAGNCAEDLMNELVGEAPTETDAVKHLNNISCIRLPGDTPRFQLLLPYEEAPAVWDQLSQTAAAASTGLWKLMVVRAGEPTVYQETVEAFVPQMANMQLVNGVSFTKGCYTGQEVVARMQYLGKLKRRMYRAEVSTSNAPQPGDEIFAAGSQSGQGAGRIVEVATVDGDRYELLVVMEIASRENNDVRLENSEGPLLTFLDLPYNFEQDNNN